MRNETRSQGRFGGVGGSELTSPGSGLILFGMAEDGGNRVESRMATSIAGIELSAPTLTASGTCGYGPEYADVLDYRQLGAFTTKSVTRHERPGNEPQRIVEVRAGMLNAIGLANVGVERFIAEKLPFIRTMPCPVLVNVAGYKIEDYVDVCSALDAHHDCLAGIELNVSCPNVADGLMFGTDPTLLREVTAACKRALPHLKLVVKLSPNVTDIARLATAAIDGGADALSLINTYVGLAIDVNRKAPMLANVTGGLSGPAIKPLALYAVHRVYRTVAQAAKIPIIGMGGVQSTRDALEFLLAGASAVAVGTALFTDPTLPVKIADGLTAYCEENGIGHISEIVGTLRLPG